MTTENLRTRYIQTYDNWCLHPPNLTRRTSHAAELPNGEKVPDVIVERLQWSAQCWQENLVEVRDDLESKYLKAQRSQLEFELTVPNYGELQYNSAAWCITCKNALASLSSAVIIPQRWIKHGTFLKIHNAYMLHLDSSTHDVGRVMPTKS